LHVLVLVQAYTGLGASLNLSGICNSDCTVLLLACSACFGSADCISLLAAPALPLMQEDKVQLFRQLASFSHELI